MNNSLRAAALALVCALTLTGCSSAPANRVHSVDDLEGKAIGVQLGTTGDLYASDYEGDAAGTKIERYSKGMEAVQSLKQGKIDCVIIDNEPAKAFIAQNKDLKILDEPFEDEDYAICVAKENTELLDKINAALAEIKADGTLSGILDNYIGDNTGNSPYVAPEGVNRSGGTLVMATNAFFEPYEFRVGDEVVGIDPDLARAICDKLGMELVIEDMEFDAIIVAVQTGKADFGMAGMTVTEDRQKSVNFTDTYVTSQQSIIVRAK